MGARSFYAIERRTRTSEAGTAQDARGDFQRQDVAAGNPFESGTYPIERRTRTSLDLAFPYAALRSRLSPAFLWGISLS